MSLLHAVIVTKKCLQFAMFACNFVMFYMTMSINCAIVSLSVADIVFYGVIDCICNVCAIEEE